MSKQANKIVELLERTFAGPVFGPGVAFGKIGSGDGTPPVQNGMDATTTRVQDIAQSLSAQLYECLKEGLPELNDAAVTLRAQAIIAKASCFVAALAPELADTKRLTQAALAISLMYAADESMDRGDRAMHIAVEQAYSNPHVAIPDELIEAVAARAKLLGRMQETIFAFSHPGDGEFVFSCYGDAVLRNEAILQRLSTEYASLPPAQQPAFLEQHAIEIATRMVEDAGVQSVTASLETQYPHTASSLLIANMHADPAIAKLIQICNAVARVADEWGDRWMDAGNDPSKGVFSINPFNQHNETLVDTLCDLAYIQDATQRAQIQDAFQNQNGEYITGVFFAHVRSYIAALPPECKTTYSRYITLAMRVLEISHVNMQGDIALAGEAAKQ